MKQKEKVTGKNFEISQQEEDTSVEIRSSFKAAVTSA